MKPHHVLSAYVTTVLAGSIIVTSFVADSYEDFISLGVVALILSALSGLPATLVLWGLQRGATREGGHHGLSRKQLCMYQVVLAVATFAGVIAVLGEYNDSFVLGLLAYGPVGTLSLLAWHKWTKRPTPREDLLDGPFPD